MLRLSWFRKNPSTLLLLENKLAPGAITEGFIAHEFKELGLVVRKPVNANLGLEVNRGNNFSCIKVISIAYVLCSLRLLMLKTEGQKV